MEKKLQEFSRLIKNLGMIVLVRKILNERIIEAISNDEVDALGHSFIVMLDRLEGAFLKQKSL